MITGLRQIETTGVNDLQGYGSVDAAVVLQHIDLVAVNGCGSGQQVVLQVLLGHVLQIAGVVDDGCVTGIVLDQAQDIGSVDVAQLLSLSLGDDDLDVVLQQGVAIVGTDFGDGVGVILQTLDDDLVLRLACLGCGLRDHGNEVGCVLLIGNMVDDIVDALFLVQFCLDEVAVGVILHDELNILEVAIAIGEQLGQLHCVGEHVSVIYQGVVVVLRGTLPQQDDFVGVAGVTVNNGLIGVHGSLIGDADGAVGVAGVDHGSAGVDALVGVDLLQAGSGHLDGHNRLICVGGAVGSGEHAVRLIPGVQQIGAGCIGEELNDDILLVVAQACAQGIDEGVLGQVGALGGDGRQSGDQLVVDDIAVGSGAGVGVAVGDIVSGAFVLAGIVHILTQGLLQGGNAGQVLGVDGNVVDPAGAAVGSIGAVNGGHGDGNEEGVAGGGDHLGNLGLNDQVQAQIQVVSLGLAIGVGQGHCGAAVGSDVALQGVLDIGGVGLQSQFQSVDQDIGLVEVLGVVQLVSVGVTLSALGQAQSVQQVGADVLVDTVQDFHMVVGDAVLLGLGELNDLSDLQVGELDALHSVAVGNVVVTQVRAVVVVTCADSIAQGLVDVLIVNAGGNVGGIPHTVLLGVREIVLEQGQAALGIGIDGSVGHISGIDSGDAGKHHDDCETHGHNLLQVFHSGIYRPFKIKK